MDHTNNLHLPQWEASDRIMHGDFNDAFAAIDTAVAEKADAATVATLQSAMPRIVIGTYTGNGAASRTISLGFTPKLLFVTRYDGSIHDYNFYYKYGGLALEGSPCTESGNTFLSIVSGGFSVVVRTAEILNSTYYFQTNKQGMKYYYIAIY